MGSDKGGEEGADLLIHGSYCALGCGRFYYDGTRVGDDDTPESLELEDGKFAFPAHYSIDRFDQRAGLVMVMRY